MSADDYARGLHGKLLAECEQRSANWERMYGELFVKAQRLTDERDELRAALQALYDATDAVNFGRVDLAEAFRKARVAAGVVLSGGNE